MRKPQLKKAIVIFRQLVESFGGYYSLGLERREDGWYLVEEEWYEEYVDGDYGSYGYWTTVTYGMYPVGKLKTMRGGAIHSLDFGDAYKGLCVLDQLRLFLREQSNNHWAYQANCRQKGDVIDVEVIGRREECCSGRSTWQRESLAKFTFDPQRNLLLYRA